MIACDGAPCWAPLPSADSVRSPARFKTNRWDKAAADKAAVAKAAADKAAAEKVAAEKVAAAKVAAERVAAEKAAADKRAAEKVAAERAAAEKVAAERAAAEKVAAERAAAEKVAAERAAAEKVAAERAAAEKVAAERARKAAADKAAADKAAADKAAAVKAAAAQDATTEPQDSLRMMLERLATAQGAASEQQDTLRKMLERLGLLHSDAPAPEPAPTTAPPGDWKTRKLFEVPGKYQESTRKLFEVPGTITEQMTQGVKDQVLSQLPEGVPFENFYPEAVISYASGKRPQDCAGAGPGMYYAADLVKLLNGRGVQCFSGLHVPPGKDWKTFMLRLEGHRARAKVLIVVLTKALFESKVR
jgi:hypothetical protein